MQFEHPLEGIFSRMAVKIISISPYGALIEHDRRLWYASRMPLEFSVEGRQVKLDCEVVSSWIERYRDPITTYRSGIRFVNVTQHLGRILQQVTGALAGDEGAPPNGWAARRNSDS
ncbi:MAG: hypothetical protein ABI718_00815 [Acidobacteriota bacterium]